MSWDKVQYFKVLASAQLALAPFQISPLYIRDLHLPNLPTQIGSICFTYWLFLCLLSADPNEEVNLAENTDYADVLATMVDVIDTNTSLVVSFSTFGRITEEEAVVDGMWVLGACSDTTF